MSSRQDLLLDLLHGTADAVLATHSLALPGFPFATHLPFAPDAGHSPVFLISPLAEHTQNLLKDERASLLLRQPGAGAERGRATLVGHARPFEADELFVARYLRYQPEAGRFLQLGDFRFFRLEPSRVRIIGGFAQAGWLEGARLTSMPTLPIEEEARWFARFHNEFPGQKLLGIDPFGLDLRREGTQDAPGTQRERLLFDPGPVLGDAVGPAIARLLARPDRAGMARH
jgi:putative heme iron utilization protein